MAGQSAIDELWKPADGAPPPQLSEILAQVQQFLTVVGYSKTASALSKELDKNGLDISEAGTEQDGAQLLKLYREWHSNHQKHLTLSGSDDTPTEDSGDSDSSASSGSDNEDEDESIRDEAEGVLVEVEAEETSDDDSDEEMSSSDGSDSDSSSGASSESISSAQAGDKRKRSSSSDDSSDDDESSSSDDSDSGKDTDEDTARPAKRVKVDGKSAKTDHGSGEDSSSASSSSDSDSDSDASSDAGSGADGAASEDDSSSSDSSDDDDAEPPPPPPSKVEKTKKGKKQREAREVDLSGSTNDAQAKDGGSLSSVTLDDVDSPAVNDTPGRIHPDRLKHLPADHRATSKKEVAELKKGQTIPFSRIPVDQKVDPRFASNAYVPYDYAERAHRDLIVTKGKGFTKEKNKKKRGAYRGGAIDLTVKGIRFDD